MIRVFKYQELQILFTISYPYYISSQMGGRLHPSAPTGRLIVMSLGCGLFLLIIYYSYKFFLTFDQCIY